MITVYDKCRPRTARSWLVNECIDDTVTLHQFNPKLASKTGEEKRKAAACLIKIAAKHIDYISIEQRSTSGTHVYIYYK